MAQPRKVFSCYQRRGWRKCVLANTRQCCPGRGWICGQTPWTPTANCTCTVGRRNRRSLSAVALQAHDNAMFSQPQSATGPTLWWHGRAAVGSPKSVGARLRRGRPGNPAQDWGNSSITSTAGGSAVGRRTDRAICPTYPGRDWQCGWLTRFPTGHAVAWACAPDVRRVDGFDAETELA